MGGAETGKRESGAEEVQGGRRVDQGEGEWNRGETTFYQLQHLLYTVRWQNEHYIIEVILKPFGNNTIV